MTNSLTKIALWWWRHIGGQRATMAAVALIGCARVACGLAFVWVSRTLVDTAVSRQGDGATMLTLSATLAALLLAELALALVAQRLSIKGEIVLKNRLRSRLLHHLLASRWVERQQLHSGDLLTRLTEDVRMLSEVTMLRLPQMAMMMVQFVGAFALLCLFSWRLALCTAAIAPLFALLSKMYVRRTRSLTREVRRAESDMQVSMQEGIGHQMVMQTLEATPRIEEEVEGTLRSLLGSTMARLKFSLFSGAMLRLSFVACFLTAFLWSVWHLHTGSITFGTMTLFLQLVARLQNPVSSLTQHIPSLVQSITSVERLMELEALTPEEKGTPRMLGAPLGIRFSNVEFGYPGEKRKIFSGFSHDFAPGSKTVLMGATGVGKSTLTKMILGLLAPDAGTILLYTQGQAGGTPASADTRCNIAYVPQGNSLLQGTVRENLLLASPHATEREMADALNTADAGFVFSLPRGIDTKCGESANTLSEGEAQRIAIARALLQRGSILIFDEFNSSLDSDTADRILRRLMESRPHATMLFISHRPEVQNYCSTLTLTPAVCR